jgi:pimeloyl-ACP methyl ester carboxylesterase
VDHGARDLGEDGVTSIDARRVPVYFRSGDESLFGVHTLVSDDPSRGVVVAPGGWYGTGTARNRLVVRMCRELAERGHDSFSFEYRGVGESTGDVYFNIHYPVIADLEAALSCVNERGMTSTILVGICYGARTVLLAAPEHENVAGLVLVCLPPTDKGLGGGKAELLGSEMTFRQMLKKGMDPRVVRSLGDEQVRRAVGRFLSARGRAIADRFKPGRGKEAGTPNGDTARKQVNTSVVDSFAEVVKRGIPTLLLYGDADFYYTEMRTALEGPLGGIIGDAGDLVTLRILAGEAQTFGTPAIQEAIVQAVADWTADVLAADARPIPAPR